MSSADSQITELAAEFRAAHPELEAVRAAAHEPVFAVGGAVRDLLLGHPRGDVDLLVLGDAAALAERLGGEAVEHERFGTAEVVLAGCEIDLAGARTETYPEPGALPVVSPAASVEEDLARRDFTVNAIALPLADEPRLVDPHGGRADLRDGALRVLHPRSFLDDPTRAIRAARYAARLGFSPEAETAALLREADLATVSADRRRAELLRLAGEESAPRGFELLAEWGLLRPPEGGPELAARVIELLAAAPWRDLVAREEAVLAAVLGDGGDPGDLLAAPARPSQGVELAAGREPVELVLARALGAAWLDRYLAEWRATELEIGGEDLLAAAGAA